MSKLLDHLQAYEIRERTYKPQPLKMVTSTATSFDTGNYATIYRVETRLGAQVTVTDELKQQSNVDWEMLVREKVYRPLAEEVFGEFREPLLQADLAIMQGDPEKASALIREVLRSMFKV